MFYYLCPIVSAILTFLPFFSDTLWPLTFISLTPYLLLLVYRNFTTGSSFKYGFIYGFTFYLLGMGWLWKLYPLTNFGFNNISSFFIILLSWILISIYGGITNSILSVIFIKLKSIISSNILILPSLWVIIEWGQSLGPLGFPWFRLPIALTKVPYLLQLSSIIGNYSTSFLIVLINLAIIYIFINIHNLKILKILVLSLVGVITINLFINSIIFSYNPIVHKKINFSIIQGNISSYNKVEEKYVKDNLNAYIKLTKDSLKERELDLVLWPETAVPIYLNRNKEILDLYKSFSIENKINLIVGAFTLSETKKYNSLFCIKPNGDISGPYSKGHLVPFGEFIPLSKIIYKTFPKLKDLEAFSDNLNGDENTPTLESSFGIIGAFICFESIFSNIPRSEVLNGAEILCLATNDSWFKDSIQLDQHLRHSILRSIEFNRYILVSANTGISASIDNKGRLLETVPKEHAGYITGEANLIKSNTIYSYIGDAPFLCFCISIISFHSLKKLYNHKKC